MASLKVAFLASLLCMVVVSAPMAHAAITCGHVTSSLAPCIGYIQKGGSPPAPCYS
ncbi:Non-specific lipid-transfer protein 1 [Glycine soja]|uniref:Non-specific lipid-transfer protein 1 n=1 Tax=Glycine soja TaxID=3848 RepID=A0A445L6Y7_GLYSO|nr:Non-specific lipid-transfer protein 1 [Glycine soja]